MTGMIVLNSRKTCCSLYLIEIALLTPHGPLTSGDLATGGIIVLPFSIAISLGGHCLLILSSLCISFSNLYFSLDWPGLDPTPVWQTEFLQLTNLGA